MEPLKNFDVKTVQRWFAERRIPVQFIDLKEKDMGQGEFDSVVDAIARQSGSRSAVTANRLPQQVCSRKSGRHLEVTQATIYFV